MNFHWNGFQATAVPTVKPFPLPHHNKLLCKSVSPKKEKAVNSWTQCVTRAFSLSPPVSLISIPCPKTQSSILATHSGSLCPSAHRELSLRWGTPLYWRKPQAKHWRLTALCILYSFFLLVLEGGGGNPPSWCFGRLPLHQHLKQHLNKISKQ